MDKIGSMQVVQSLGNLIGNISFMLLTKNILSDESIQVNIHELKKQIHISIIVRSDDVLKFDDIWVSKLLQKHDFPIGPLSIN
jgi:hypothetical protein